MRLLAKGHLHGLTRFRFAPDGHELGLLEHHAVREEGREAHIRTQGRGDDDEGEGDEAFHDVRQWEALHAFCQRRVCQTFVSGGQTQKTSTLFGSVLVSYG